MHSIEKKAHNFKKDDMTATLQNLQKITQI